MKAEKDLPNEFDPHGSMPPVIDQGNINIGAACATGSMTRASEKREMYRYEASLILREYMEAKGYD